MIGCFTLSADCTAISHCKLLPSVVEVIRWFNMTMLEDFWDVHLHAESELMAYAACCSLKYSIVHAVALMKILRHPPKTWQV